MISAFLTKFKFNYLMSEFWKWKQTVFAYFQWVLVIFHCFCFHFNWQTMAIPAGLIMNPIPIDYVMTKYEIFQNLSWNAKQSVLLFFFGVLGIFENASITLFTAWPMWTSPLAYGGPSCNTNSFPFKCLRCH